MRLVALLFGSLVLTACAPKLVVRHRDNTRPQAVVYVDDQRVGVVRIGSQMSVSLDEGAHAVRVVDPTSNETPWHPGRGELPVVLDEQVILTLLPDAEPDR